MDFEIKQRVDAGKGWEIGRKGTKAFNTIYREGRLSSSSYESEIHCISVCEISEVEKERCYNLEVRKKIPELKAAWHAQASLSYQKLFGPASLLLNKVIVYPCSKFGCKVPCCCRVCRTRQMRKIEDVNFEELITEKNHWIYHKAWHIECKFCNNIFNIIPMFKFFMWENDRFGGGLFLDQGLFKHCISTRKEEKSLEENRYTCKDCEATFSRPQDLLRHCFSIHLGQYYSCELCSTDFNRKDELKRHIHNVHEYFSKCKDCNTKFSSEKHLRRHITARNTVDGNSKHVCEICNIKACTQRSLIKHKKTHDNSCEECGHIFSRSSALVTHRKNTRRSCKDCDLNFCTKKSMNIHRKKHHFSVIMCNYCQEPFSTKYNLKIHIVRQH